MKTFVLAGAGGSGRALVGLALAAVWICALKDDPRCADGVTVGRFTGVSDDLIIRPIIEKASMLRDAGVRGKLFAVLAIPTVLLVVVSGWLVGGQVQAARQAGQINEVTDVALQLNRVVHSLQLERTVTLDYLQGVTAGGISGVQGQRQYTNSQLIVLRDKIAASPLKTMSASIQAAAARSAKAHNELASIRKSIDAGTSPSAESDAAYGKIIANDLQLPGAIAASASPELAQRLMAEQALSTTIESASHERDLIELAYLDGTITEAEFGQASALLAQQNQSLEDFQRSAPIELFVPLNVALKAADTTQLEKSRGDLSNFLRGSAPDFDASVDWQKAANPRIASMVATEGQLVPDIANVAADIEHSEQLKAGIFGAGAFFGLVLALLLALLLGQRITLPLRRLTLAAAEIGDQLPRMVERMQTPGEGPGDLVDPIPVEGNDEIGRLAAAFNTVNEVTLRVAKEQAALRASIAEMFVNVARRNQVLLGRQLAQLDKMEAREENPDLLKNLFRLDHLATRMRRNAESLLVLAGIDSTRRLREALPLSEVIGAAVSEIEAYERIDSSVTDDPDVSGRHALSVAHLIAELLENATVFSNPDTRVVVASAMTGRGVDVTITDYGLGMSDEEIAEANESIANPPLAEIAVSQRLGLFVVGRIAARLGATASLRKGRTSGTVVTIGLPLDLFEGLQVDEPVTLDQVADTSEDAVVTESLLDEPIREDVLVASVPQFASAAAPVAEAPTVEVALFNPSEVALSRLPQVDVAALVADAAADVHFASPVPTDSSRRRLLPRRSRSDEPAGPAEVAPDDTAGEADEVAADVAPVEISPVDDSPFTAVDDLQANVLDAEVPDAEMADEAPDADVPDAELADEAPPEIVADARRRGSFFQRRRAKSAPDQTEPAELEQFDVAAAETPADADDLAAAAYVEEQAPRLELPVDEGLLDDSEVVGDLNTGGDAPLPEAPVVVPSPGLSRRRSRRSRRGEQAVEPTNQDSPAEQVATEEPSAYEPVSYEPFASEPVTPALDPFESLSYEPDALEPVAVQATEMTEEESAPADAVLEQPVDEADIVAPIRRRGLFGRRQWVADKPLAEEPVDEDAVPLPVAEDVAPLPVAEDVAPLPVAEDVAPLPVAEESVVESHIEAPAVEDVFTSAFETGPPQFAWPVADAPMVDEPVAVEPAAGDALVSVPTFVEPVAVEAFVVESSEQDVYRGAVDDAAVDDAAAADPVDGEPSVDERVDDAVADEPARRRGLFGRRKRAAVEPVAVEEPQSEPEEADVVLAPIAESPVRESFPPPAPEPVLEPVPAAALYYATAIDILPGKAMGRRGKHAIPVPSSATPPTPAAPESTYAADAPVVAPQFAAQLPQRGPAPAAPPRQASALDSAPAPVERSPFDEAAVQSVFEPAAVEPSLFDYAKTEVKQPVVSATMSELDQLALNAELQSSALSELRSLYEPAFNQGTAPSADAQAGLIRRQRRAVEAPVAAEPVVPSRSRDAVEVRGMLSGFRAGVERGRSASSSVPNDADPGENATTGAQSVVDATTDATSD